MSSCFIVSAKPSCNNISVDYHHNNCSLIHNITFYFYTSDISLSMSEPKLYDRPQHSALSRHTTNKLLTIIKNTILINIITERINRIKSWLFVKAKLCPPVPVRFSLKQNKFDFKHIKQYESSHVVRQVSNKNTCFQSLMMRFHCILISLHPHVNFKQR